MLFTFSGVAETCLFVGFSTLCRCVAIADRRPVLASKKTCTTKSKLDRGPHTRGAKSRHGRIATPVAAQLPVDDRRQLEQIGLVARPGGRALGRPAADGVAVGNGERTGDRRHVGEPTKLADHAPHPAGGVARVPKLREGAQSRA